MSFVANNIQLFSLTMTKTLIKLERLSLPFHPGLIFKAKSLSLTGRLKRCYTWAGSYLTCKYKTLLEKLASDKWSSLFIHFIRDKEKGFIRLNFGMTFLARSSWTKFLKKF
jgi:hypothetical protein